MPHPSASADLMLPFGSLTGVVPTDCVWQKRVIGDFSTVIDRGWLVAESAAISAVARSAVARPDRDGTLLSPSSYRAGDGGI